MIEVKNIGKDFVSPKKYPGLKGAIKGLFSTEKVVKSAVKDISFTIQDGEIVGYIGSNGAGKSTTIKIMTGILSPTKGQCLVNGIDPNKKRKENRVEKILSRRRNFQLCFSRRWLSFVCCRTCCAGSFFRT